MLILKGSKELDANAQYYIRINFNMYLANYSHSDS